MWIALVLLSVSCGSDESDAQSTGTVTPEWQSYCVATFTEDFEVLDAFDEPMFTARAGEAYLMAEYGDGFDGDSAVLFYLTAQGPMEFELSAPAGSLAFPVTTPCEFENSVRYYGVFANVTVYESEALSTVLCELEAGTVLPADATQQGYSSLSLNLFGPNTYEVYLNAFSATCGGAERGYVSVSPVEVLGVTTWLVPYSKLDRAQLSARALRSLHRWSRLVPAPFAEREPTPVR